MSLTYVPLVEMATNYIGIYESPSPSRLWRYLYLFKAQKILWYKSSLYNF